MKKRVLSLLLTAVMLVGLMPAAFAAVKDEKVEGAGSNRLSGISVEIKTAWKATVTVQPGEALTSGSQIFAVLMRSQEFKAQYSGDVTKINADNYASLTIPSDYYKHGSQSYNGDSQPRSFQLDLKSFSVGATVSGSYQEYTVAALDNRGTTGAGDYATLTFRVGSDGFLYGPGLVFRYDGNRAANGTNVAPGSVPNSALYRLEGEGPYTFEQPFLLGSAPTRSGYTFQGWDFAQDKWQSFRKETPEDGFPMGEDQYLPKENCAAAYPSGMELTYSDLIAAWNVQYPEANFTTSTVDETFQIYAQWRPIQVGIDKNPRDPGETAGGSQPYTAKVGEAFVYAPVITGAVGSNPDATAGGGVTAKKVEILASSYHADEPQNTTLVQGASGLPEGLRLNAANGEISGTPTRSYASPVQVTLKITDQSNQTTDQVTITLPAVAKSDQPYLPELDVSTGLEATVGDPVDLTPGDETDNDTSMVEDGQIFGFYSKGNTSATANGTGSSADAYLSTAAGRQALVYEILPVSAPDGTPYGFTEYREIPLPEAHYANLPTEGDGVVTRAVLDASLTLGSTAQVHSVLTAEGLETALVSRDTPWPAAYGWIAFEDGLPVLHGLAKGAVYKIRFQENDGYQAGENTTLTVTEGGGGGGNGPSGYALVFNLMGGAVTWKAADENTGWVPPDDGAQPENPYAVPITVTGAGDVEIPNLPANAELTKAGGYAFGGFTDGMGNTYQPGGTYPMGESSVSLATVWNDTKSVRMVTYLDWDGSTQLGVMAAYQGDKLDPAAYAQLMNTLTNPSAGSFEGYTYTPNEANEGYLFNPYRLPSDNGDPHVPLLTDKGGYTFVGWIPGDAEKCHFPKGQVPEGLVLDLETYIVEDYVTLKACYEANSKCGDANVAAERSYSFYFETIERTANSYTLNLTVSRAYNSATGKFPARTYEPILLTRLVGGGEVLLPTNLENQDMTKVSFTFPFNFDTVFFDLGDMYGQSLANNAVIYSTSMVTDSSGTLGPDYVKMGTTSFISNGCAQTPATTINNISGGVGAAHFSAVLPSNAGGTLAQRRQRILYAWRAANHWERNNAPGEAGTLTKRLTIDQIVAAVTQKKNVFLQGEITFADTDIRADSVGGMFTPLLTIADTPSTITAQVPVAGEVSGWKAYWSKDGITKGDEIQNIEWVSDTHVLTIPEGTRKGMDDRFIMLCAVNGGEEFACSVVVPIQDVIQE